MSIPVIDTLHALGNFPVVDSTEVQCGNSRLDVVLSQSATSLAAKADKTYVDTNFAKKTDIPTNAYSKPTTGIPKTDLASDVQASLGKADTALQSHQSLADYVKTTDSRLTDSRPASDVPTWAKQINKPTYTASEVGALPNTTLIPSKVSELNNDIGFITNADISGKADSTTVQTLSSRVDDVETEQTSLSARMDTFSTLEDGSTTGDAELADGRIGEDGTTYTNIGGAIRGQVSDLKTAISKCIASGLSYNLSDDTIESICSNDLNNLGNNIFYGIGLTSAVINNSPVTVNKGFICTCGKISTRSNSDIQIYVTHDNVVYTRIYWSNEWKDWKRTVDYAEYKSEITKCIASGLSYNISDDTVGSVCANDLDNLPNNKFYGIGLTSATLDNSPVTTNKGLIYTYGKVSTRSNSDVQVYITNSGTTYTRIYWADKWQEWNCPALPEHTNVVSNVVVKTISTNELWNNYSMGNVPVLICDINKNWSVNPDVSSIRFWFHNVDKTIDLTSADVVTHNESNTDLCGVWLDMSTSTFHIGRTNNMVSIVTNNFVFFGAITAYDKYWYLSDCVLPVAYRGKIISKGDKPHIDWATEGNGILFDGDSITYGVMDSLNGNPRASVTMPRMVANNLNFTFAESVNNIGVSGCTIAKKTSGTTHLNDSMVQRSEKFNYSGFKVFILGGGTNDWSSEHPLGDSYDTDDITTVYGALNYILGRIYKDNKYARVLAWTPMLRFLRGGAYMNPYTLKVNGLTIIEYAKAIENYYKYKGIPVINMCENGFLTAFNRPNPNICADGLHPGQVGYEMLANKITNFVKANMY